MMDKEWEKLWNALGIIAIVSIICTFVALFDLTFGLLFHA